MSSFNHFRERIKHVPVIGSFLYRIYLLLFFREGEIVTIKDGYLKGTAIRRFHRTVFPRFVTGDYELELQNAIVRELKEGQVFYGVGANGGFFCLVAAKRMGPAGGSSPSSRPRRARMRSESSWPTSASRISRS